MSRLSNLKKPELVSLAGSLGVPTEGVKSELEARIAAHLADNPDLVASDETLAAYHLAASSPTKTRRKSKKVDVAPLSPEGVKYSPEQANDKDESESAESESEFVAKAEAVEEDLVSVIDKGKELAASAWTSISDGALDIADYIADVSDSIRHGMSSVTFVASLFTLIELGLVLKTIVPLSEKALVGYALPIPHLEVVTYWKTFWLPLFLWIAGSLLTPLLISYYINFTGAASHSKRSKSKQVTYDPFVYNGVRLIVGYFFYSTFVYYLLGLPLGEYLTDAITKAAPVISNAITGYSLFAGITSLSVTLYAAAL